MGHFQTTQLKLKTDYTIKIKKSFKRAIDSAVVFPPKRIHFLEDDVITEQAFVF